jgi:hypothetical protein
MFECLIREEVELSSFAHNVFLLLTLYYCDGALRGSLVLLLD